MNKKYNIIYADPPWKFKPIGWVNRDRQKNKREPEKYYDTMTLEDICDLPVRNITDKNCYLFMWTTSPFLEKSFSVMSAWGFEYKTVGFVWVKSNNDGTLFKGLGNYTRANAEICLIGKRGLGTDIFDRNIMNTQILPRERHSKKPDKFRDDIVKLCGNVPKIELFAREKFDGWDYYGNEL